MNTVNARAHCIRPILAAGFALAMAFALSACGNDGGGGNTFAISSSSEDAGTDNSSSGGGTIANPSSSSITQSSSGNSSSNGNSSGSSSSSNASSSNDTSSSSAASSSANSSYSSEGSSSSKDDPSSSSTTASVECPAYNSATHFCDNRDGKIYKWVKIGTENWMGENLNYEVEGSECYDNLVTNCEKYGRLYNWNTSLGICPSGWRIPSKMEWYSLMTAVGGTSTAGKKLKATSGWNSYTPEYSYGDVLSGNGTDDFGFTALPGGSGSGNFSGVGYHGNWWSSSQGYPITSTAYRQNIIYNASYMDYTDNSCNKSKAMLYSVRCLKGN